MSECGGNAGPNTNNVEKLAELRRAGVNIGAFRSLRAIQTRSHVVCRGCC